MDERSSLLTHIAATERISLEKLTAFVELESAIRKGRDGHFTEAEGHLLDAFLLHPFSLFPLNVCLVFG
jgi:hypothetical protein